MTKIKEGMEEILEVYRKEWLSIKILCIKKIKLKMTRVI
jgi:hypothetical protein